MHALTTVVEVLRKPEHQTTYKRLSHAVRHCPIKPKQSRYVQEQFGSYPLSARLMGEGLTGPSVEHTPETDQLVTFCFDCIQDNVQSVLQSAGGLASLGLEEIMSVGHSMMTLSTSLVCVVSDECECSPRRRL